MTREVAAALKIELTKDILRSRSFYLLQTRIVAVIFSNQEIPKTYSVTISFDYLYVDMTPTGEPILIEVFLPRNKWITVEGLRIPKEYNTGRLFFNQDYNRDVEAKYLTNRKRDILCIQFSKDAYKSYRVADTVIVDLDAELNLSRIWIEKIVSDFLYVRETVWKLKEAVRP